MHSKCTKNLRLNMKRRSFEGLNSRDLISWTSRYSPKLINQVANETMEQFQTKFDHLSMNSRFSANVDNLDDLDDTASRDMLLDVLSDV